MTDRVQDWGAKALEAYAAFKLEIVQEQVAREEQERTEDEFLLINTLQDVLGVSDGFRLEPVGSKMTAFLDGMQELRLVAYRGRYDGRLYAAYETDAVEDVGEDAWWESFQPVDNWRDLGAMLAWRLQNELVVRTAPKPEVPQIYSWVTAERMNALAADESKNLLVMGMVVWDPDREAPVMLVRDLDAAQPQSVRWEP